MEEQSIPSGFNFKSRKAILGIAGFLILLIAIPLAVYLIQQQQIFKPKAGGGTPPPVSGPETSFSLMSSLEGGPNFVPLGQKVRISVLVRSDIDAANLFAAKLTFPTNILEIEEIIAGENNNCTSRPGCLDSRPACKIPEPAEGWCTSDGGAFFIKNWVEKVYDNKAGTISLVGGVPNPGYTTTVGQPGGKMVEIVFKTKAIGDAYVDFDEGTAIYRNSDNNNILDIKRPVDFRVLSSATPTPTLSMPSITITSPSGQVTWVTGETRRVSWSNSHSNYVRIYIENPAIFGSGSTNYIYDGTIPGSQGYYDWKISQNQLPTGPNYRLRIDGINTTNIGAEVVSRGYSNDLFRIVSLAPAPPEIPGDVNGDGKITLVDMSALLSKWGKTKVEAGRADITGKDDKPDGLVNSMDYSKMLNILLDKGIIKSASEAPSAP